MHITKVTKFIDMFTGIIETLGRVVKIKKDKGNTHFTIQTDITNELKVDQSVAHNGVCLTVVEISDDTYVVTAIQETLDKTNLGNLTENDLVNIERAMKLGDRLDGHIVQGHVDQTAICTQVSEHDGSWFFTFEYDVAANNITIEKGSITVNGVSLTVVNSKKNLKYLVKESQTPKGLNEQGVKELTKAGFYKSLEKTLNSIHKRLNK